MTFLINLYAMCLSFGLRSVVILLSPILIHHLKHELSYAASDFTLGNIDATIYTASSLAFQQLDIIGAEKKLKAQVGFRFHTVQLTLQFTLKAALPYYHFDQVLSNILLNSRPYRNTPNDVNHQLRISG